MRLRLTHESSLGIKIQIYKYIHGIFNVYITRVPSLMCVYWHCRLDTSLTSLSQGNLFFTSFLNTMQIFTASTLILCIAALNFNLIEVIAILMLQTIFIIEKFSYSYITFYKKCHTPVPFKTFLSNSTPFHGNDFWGFVWLPAVFKNINMLCKQQELIIHTRIAIKGYIKHEAT